MHRVFRSTGGMSLVQRFFLSTVSKDHTKLAIFNTRMVKLRCGGTKVIRLKMASPC